MGTRLTKRKFRKKEEVTKPKMAKAFEVFDMVSGYELNIFQHERT